MFYTFEMDVFKEDTLKNRVAFITGGGTGIGFGIAKKFVQHGASVVIMGRRQAVLFSFLFFCV